jgi:H+/Cl- antiporter ClcA
MHFFYVLKFGFPEKHTRGFFKSNTAVYLLPPDKETGFKFNARKFWRAAGLFLLLCQPAFGVLLPACAHPERELLLTGLSSKACMFQNKIFARFSHPYYLVFAGKWLLISMVVGSLAGSASALFLYLLEAATQWREGHPWVIGLLPIAGLLIAALYHYWGQEVVKGNNQLLEEVENPQKIIPLKMAPLVLATTVLTHLFGGSAGREGTAVQLGGAVADQFTRLLRLKNRDRRLLIVCGISAGFASVFGTPLAGAVFAIEVLVIGRLRYDAIIPSLFAALVADYVCRLYPIHHTHYTMGPVPALDAVTFLWAVVAGIAFGLAAWLFSGAMHQTAALFAARIRQPLLRPVLGGVLVAGFVLLSGSTRYIGLGIPVLVESFTTRQEYHVFLLKIALTVITLGSGFKGGEVTPLFFIGATLGSALSGLLPLPVGLLAGMGLVAVFAGAANTPLACTLLGLELFGMAAGPYLATASFIAYVFSGHTGIYRSQIIGGAKHPFFIRQQNRKLKDL